MSHLEHFFLEHVPAVFTSPKSPVKGCEVLKKGYFSLRFHVVMASYTEMQNRATVTL